MRARISVLLVDDSPTVRAVLRRLLNATPDIEVVGEAGNGQDAVDSTLRRRPDVILMDLEMPEMDGFTAIERIMALRATPIVVVSARANRDQMQTAFEAIRRGAVEVLGKPEDTLGWNDLARTLPEIVRSVAHAHASTAPVPVPHKAPHAPLLVDAWPVRHIAIGASTGGPQAIHALLAALPARISASVLIVQHISPGFEEALADWLAKDLKRDVRPAQNGELAQPGAIRIAPPGAHLRLDKGGILRLDRQSPPQGGHQPSADILFSSCASTMPREVAGVLLSGMGRDGAEGLGALRRAGGFTVVQDEASCVVFGMPRCALERGAAEIALAPAEIGRLLTRFVHEVKP